MYLAILYTYVLSPLFVLGYLGVRHVPLKPCFNSLTLIFELLLEDCRVSGSEWGLHSACFTSHGGIRSQMEGKYQVMQCKMLSTKCIACGCGTLCKLASGLGLCTVVLFFTLNLQKPTILYLTIIIFSMTQSPNIHLRNILYKDYVNRPLCMS